MNKIQYWRCWVLVLLGCGGCSHTYVVQGYSSAEPSVEAQATKQWSEAQLHTGWEIEGWLGAECSTRMQAWCDRDGRWGIVNTIANHTDTHVFTTAMVFGHVDNGDFRKFVEIARHSATAITVAKGEEKRSAASGSEDASISQGFNRINAIRPVVIVQGGVGWPISFQDNATFTCTPDAWPPPLPKLSKNGHE
jgi:hypothetical protein